MHACRHLLYLSTPSTEATAAGDLRAAVSALVRTTAVFASTALSTASSNIVEKPLSDQAQQRSRQRPQALMVAFYNQQCQGDCAEGQKLPPNIASCLPPDGSLDVDSAIAHAKSAFSKLYPDAASAFDSAAVSNDDDDASDDEALDILGDVLQNLSSS